MTKSNPYYNQVAGTYADYRQPDPRIAAQLMHSLEGCSQVLNVGAGTGSYEPEGTDVIALEASIEMIRNRDRAANPAVRGVAGQLPFADNSVDAAIAILTLHHWPDFQVGLSEMRRVARDRIVLFTWDPDLPPFWLVRDYFPEITAIDKADFPSLSELETVLDEMTVTVVPVPADCTDGFLGGYWRRPECYLDEQAISAISVFSKFDYEAGLSRLRRDLENGAWLEKNKQLMSQESLDVGYRLIVANA